MYHAWYIYNDGKGNVGFNGNTPKEIMEKAEYYVEYYHTIYPEFGKLEVTKNCLVCDGTGKKGKPKKRNLGYYQNCPKCEGKGTEPLTLTETQLFTTL